MVVIEDLVQGQHGLYKLQEQRLYTVVSGLEFTEFVAVKHVGFRANNSAQKLRPCTVTSAEAKCGGQT